MSQNPNVIVIVPHDIGDYLGCYGHKVSTPNIDRLADEGVRFSNHFCTSPFCSPSRGSIITGKYPHANGLMGLCNLGWDLPKYNITDGQWFADAGYCTYLGYQHEKKAPEDLGFQHLLQVDAKDGNEYTVNSVKAVEQVFKAHHDEAASGGESKPFYIRMGTYTGHRGVDPATGNYEYPLNPELGVAEPDVELHPKWKDTPGLRHDLRGFTGDVKFLDNAVGDILTALKKYGFEDNTLVVFTADHGIDFPGGKSTLYDLGLRTPLILRCPDRIVAGKVIDGLTSHIDILPTMLEFCHFAGSPSIQGKSLLPLIEGEKASVHPEIFAEESTYPKNLKRCIRTERYKLIRNFSTGVQSNAAVCSGSRTVEGTGRFYFVNRPEYELYDLSIDPDELNNLAGTAGIRVIEEELRGRLNRWMRETHDPVIEGKIQRPADEADLLNALPRQFQNEHLHTLWIYEKERPIMKTKV